MKRCVFFAVLFLLVAPQASDARRRDRLQAPQKALQKDEAALFKGVSQSHTGIGLIEQKDQELFNKTIEREKSYILRKTMSHIYDDAYALFRQQRYGEAMDLLERIVTIDPGFDKARFLHSALSGADLGGGGPAVAVKSTRQIIQDKFYEAIQTYREGRKVEAIERFYEVLALEPRHRKAQYYINRINGDMAKEYFEKGKLEYTQGHWEAALESFYTAVNLDSKNYSFLSRQIADLESEVRSRKLQTYLSEALKQLSESNWPQARDTARRIFDYDPGNVRAKEIVEEAYKGESEIYFARGDRHLKSKEFDKAIEAYKHVLDLRYRATDANRKIALAKKAREDEEARQRRLKEEEEARKQAEERAKEATQAAGGEGAAGAAQEGGGTAAAAAEPTEDAVRASEGHYQQGIKYYQMGQLQNALAELNLALKFNPNNQNAYTAKRRIEAELTR